MSECRLILGDCLKVLRGMDAGCVDAIVTDPPYGQSNEWYDRGVNPDVWRECFRVAKSNAALVSFAGSPTYHRIASDIEAAGWKVRQMWAWIYRDGLITSAYPREGFDRLAPAMDPICFATKGKVLLNLEREGSPWTAPAHYSGYSNRSQHAIGDGGANGHWPRQIVADNGIGGFSYFMMARGGQKGSDQRTGHPNQKPLALMKWLVAKFSGPTVLDPFMGSGTTGVACQVVGRKFIGIEVDSEYHAIAQRRLAEVCKPDLFGHNPLIVEG